MFFVWLSETILNYPCTQLEPLYNRTGLEILLIAVRSDEQSVTCPEVWTTSQRVEQFFQLTAGTSLMDFAGKLECYCLSGLEGECLVGTPLRALILCTGGIRDCEYVRWRVDGVEEEDK